MSVKIICDGCGAESPDAKGFYVANYWPTVTVAYRWGHMWPRTRTLRYCKNCMKRLLATARELGSASFDFKVMDETIRLGSS